MEEFDPPAPADADVPSAEQPRVPIALLSYSHDSREHKTWTAALAQRLRENGIDLIFDQWDLGPGDDAPKFMEKGVAAADCVLMICTEAYVRKADDGNGGAGYEAMVVTGELVRNLGSRKFIPIIRQTNRPFVMPRCIGTRIFVDLADGPSFEDNFKVLLHRLHDVPVISKPPLGRNPFAPGAFSGSRVAAEQTQRRLEFSEDLKAPETAYHRAQEVLGRNDRMVWRKLLLAAAEQSAQNLADWRVKLVSLPSDEARVIATASVGLETHRPLIACLLAAAETGRDGYADQLSWVDTILAPKGHDGNGSSYHVRFPEVVFFVTQALVGGMLLLSNSGEAAYRLAITKLPDRYESSEAHPLFAMRRFNGWPASLNTHCTLAWKLLNEVITSWTWLREVFGNEEQCRASIAGYYQLLSFLNFLQAGKNGELETDPQNNITTVTAPLCFCVWPGDIVKRGYELFLEQAHILRRLLDANRVDETTFDANWTRWRVHIGAWLGNVYREHWLEVHVPQASLPLDLKTDPYRLP